VTKLATGAPRDSPAATGERPAARAGRPAQAIGARWPLVLLCALLLAGAGVALGLARKPTYTTSAQINVGRLDVTAQSMPGFAQASQNLTVAYSELVKTDPVVDHAARRLGLAPAALRGRLSSHAIDKSSIFYVQATGPSAASAQHAANVTAAATVRYLERNQDTSGERTDLLRQYRHISARLVKLQRSLGKVGGALHQGGASDAEKAAFAKLTVDRQQAELEARGIAATYQQKNFGTAHTSGLQIVRPAVSASSDRVKYAEALGVAGLVGGSVIGAGLALLLHRRRRRRAGRLAG
jgi:subunit length determinant Wzz-like protein